jgi:hypothetical protein
LPTQQVVFLVMGLFMTGRLCWLVGLLGGLLASVHAQDAGTVLEVRGAGLLYRSQGGAPVALGKGQSLQTGDRLTTAPTGLALVQMSDGARVSIRPGSDMVLKDYRFQPAATDNRMVVQLLKGGLRSVSGLVAKTGPDAARVETKTATVGIRGTDFDVRLCERDCAAERGAIRQPPRDMVPKASARVLSFRGGVQLQGADGVARPVVEGSPVYPGDRVETGGGAQVILALRDGGVVVLDATTRWHLDDFVHDPAQPTESRLVARVLSGAARVMGGPQMAERGLTLVTPAAAVRLGRSGVDVACQGSCDGASQNDTLTVFAWKGGVAVQPNGANETPLAEGQGVLLRGGAGAPHAAPLAGLPNVETLQVPTTLFGQAAVDQGGEGLWVAVRDGHVALQGNQGTLHLGKGEAGVLRNDGALVRPTQWPLVIEFDRTPHPATSGFALQDLLGRAGVLSNQCR